MYIVSPGLFPPSLETILNSSNLAAPFKAKIRQHLSCEQADDVTIKVNVPVVADSVPVVEGSVPVVGSSAPVVRDLPFKSSVEAVAITPEAAAITAEAVVTELSSLAAAPTAENTAQKLCTKKILGRQKKPAKSTDILVDRRKRHAKSAENSEVIVKTRAKQTSGKKQKR